MALTTNSVGGNTTFTMVRTVSNAQAQNLNTNFTAAMYQRGYAHYPRDNEGAMIPPAQLTNAQKLAMLEIFMIDSAREAARRYLQDIEESNARATIQQTINTSVDL